MISVQVEAYDTCKAEIDTCLEAHWHEVAMYKDTVPLDKDEMLYQNMANEGALHIVTCRDDGVLVGYVAGFVKTHPHYKTTLWCFTDVYWLRPDCRKGWTAWRMFKLYRQSMHDRGIKVATISTKLFLDMSKLFLKLGWEPRETVFSCIP